MSLNGLTILYIYIYMNRMYKFTKTHSFSWFKNVKIYLYGFLQTENNDGESNPEDFSSERLIAHGREKRVTCTKAMDCKRYF